MEADNINSILQKYWEGETTLEQEEQLLHYFQGKKVAHDLLQYKPMFELIGQTRKLAPSEKFELRLNEQIRKQKKDEAKPIINLSFFVRIAAALTLIVGSYFLYQNAFEGNQNQTDLFADTFQSPEDALEAMMLAFGSLGEQMAESTAMMENEIKKLDNINSYLY